MSGTSGRALQAGQEEKKATNLAYGRILGASEAANHQLS